MLIEKVTILAGVSDAAVGLNRKLPSTEATQFQR
jgi:hypothetical protein